MVRRDVMADTLAPDGASTPLGWVAGSPVDGCLPVLPESMWRSRMWTPHCRHIFVYMVSSMVWDVWAYNPTPMSLHHGEGCEPQHIGVRGLLPLNHGLSIKRKRDPLLSCTRHELRHRSSRCSGSSPPYIGIRASLTSLTWFSFVEIRPKLWTETSTVHNFWTAYRF